MVEVKFHMVKDEVEASEFTTYSPKMEKDVIVKGPSVCEAQVLASRQNKDFAVISHKVLKSWNVRED